jgi:Holliday junction resolvase RusA-like endonuclease
VSDLVITVYGTPAPQGSKRHVGNGVMVESSAAVKPWREAVKAAALETSTRTLSGAVEVWACFYLKRPKYHYGTGRNALYVKPRYLDARPDAKPDLDKLLRSTLDALSDAGIWRDDSQVVRIEAGKWWADLGKIPGATIYVRAVAP